MKRCPRCGHDDLTATETTEAFMDFNVRNGVVTRITHTDEFGAVLSVKLKCNSCGHRWRPRNVHQVTDLSAAI